MNTAKQIRIPAVYMRGGTSKGVFFHVGDLPVDPKQRDAVLMRVMGSPDPYQKQTDGMGAATSSTSKVVLIRRSEREDCDVDYLFGQVGIDTPFIDWSGNCGNLTAAVGPFAISQGLVPAPHTGRATVRIWQANIEKRIIAHVPVVDGQVQELGEFMLDGVAFPAAEIPLEFLEPGDGDALFPTGNTLDVLEVPRVGRLQATLINAGNPAIFVDAAALGLTGAEMQADVNENPALLARCEAIRAYGAVRMGLAASMEEASAYRQHTPKLAFFAPPSSFTSSAGKALTPADMDITARILSMGRLHHAMTGTGAVGIAAAAAVDGTIPARVMGGARQGLRFGHPSGTLRVGAQAELRDGRWAIAKVTMSRSARRLMEGWVWVPETGALT